jgi:3-oxoacyl-[acyl-carrier protein] reductase
MEPLVQWEEWSHVATRLDGKVALITGASSGIGQATARLFAQEGAAGIGINYGKSEEGARRTLQAVEAAGSRGLLVQGDVADEGRVRAIVDAVVKEFGRLDILVNNAATTFFVDMADLDGMTEEKWDRIYDVNVKGLFWCSRAAAAALRRAKGQIINVSSKAGITGSGSSIAYAASKAAVISLTKGLAGVLAPDVRVNTVAPGMVDSPWNTGREDRVAGAAKSSPLKRVATSEDIASVILDLAAGFALATGSVIVVDGGAGGL